MPRYYGDTYPFTNPHNFDVPGKYVIHAAYVEDLKTGTPKHEAPALVVHVKALSQQRADGLLRDLRDNQSTNRLKVLGLLRRGQFRQVVPVAVEIVESSSDLALKHEAARSIYELADVVSGGQLVRLLKGKDPIVQGFVALTLGRLKDKESVPELIEICDSANHPESYRSAAKALIEIGDPRAIPVLERVAEREKSAEMRDMVKNAVRQMKAGPDPKPAM